MERRRTDRRKQLEMVLASLFLASRVCHNTWSCRTLASAFPPNNTKDLSAVKGPKVTEAALSGHQVSSGGTVSSTTASTSEYAGTESADKSVEYSPSLESCANTVNGIPQFVTREKVSQHDIFFSLLYAAVKRATGGVLAYLEGAELKAANRCERWEAEDYRLAQIVVLLASEGKQDPYTLAFFQLFNIHPAKVVSWWRNPRKLMAIAERANCPTPLLVRDAEAYLQIVPDYDYSRRSK